MIKFAFPVFLSLFLTLFSTSSFSQTVKNLAFPLMMLEEKKSSAKAPQLLDPQKRQTSREDASANFSSLVPRGSGMPHIPEENVASQPPTEAVDQFMNIENTDSAPPPLPNVTPGDQSLGTEEVNGSFASTSGAVAIKQDNSLEAVRLNQFLEQIKNTIDPKDHAALIDGIQQGSLNPNPFLAGIAWRNKIKDTTVFTNQSPEQQENYIQNVLRQAQEAHCEVYHLPYRLDEGKRVKILPTKERIHSLLYEARDTAQDITDDSFEEYPYLVRAFLRSILPANPSTQKLVDQFEEASSSQEKIKILNEIGKISFFPDSNSETLQKNLENKKSSLHLLQE